MEAFYKRHLPHIQPTGGIFFVTFNLYGSVPKEVYARWKEEYTLDKAKIIQHSKNKNTDFERLGKLEFAKKDKFWDSYTGGNHYLKNDSIAKFVADTMHHWDGQRLELYAYCIMSNHVHVVFRLFDETEIKKPFYLEQIMQSIKRFSARECNKLLGETGSPFWQNESYDRLVRNDDELRRIMVYVLNNPVKAGLCSKMSDWKWSYIKETYNDIM